MIDIAGATEQHGHVAGPANGGQSSHKSLHVLAGLRSLFASGWAFFLPYAFLYALGYGLGWTNATVRSLFWMCHIGLGAAFFLFAFTALRASHGDVRRVLRDPQCWFWALLGLGFLLPGAYLEFPADPWEHFRRLHAWDPGAALRHSPWAFRFAYFWGWTFFSVVPLIHQRLMADVYSGFWQMLLAYQFYLFGFRLSGSRTWALVHVVGVVALFGNNMFGFFRYYALASTMLAYIAYLAAAMTVLDVLEGRRPARRAIPTLVATVCLMVFNHTQECLLLILFSLAATFAVVWMRLSPRMRLSIAAVSLAGFGLSLLVARGAMAYPAAFHLTPSRFYYPWMSKWGVFRLWDVNLTYFTTMGLHGILAVLLGVVLWRSRPLIALLTLAPVIVLTVPWFAIPLAQIGPPLPFTYRVLFLLPTSVILITAFQVAARFVDGASGRANGLLQGAGLVLILVLGLYERTPVFGKLRFQYYRPSGSLEARYVDEAVRWFSLRRPRVPACPFTGDEVTESVVGAFFGSPLRFDRVSGTTFPGYGWSAKNVLELIDQAAAYSPCGFLVPDPAPGPWRSDPSYYGPLSGHWGRKRANPMVRTPLGLRENVPFLVERGWTKTFVPPFYSYYEPPAHGKWR